MLIQWVKPRPYTSKNPLILRTNYACHVFLIACVTLQSFSKNISLSKITTAAPPLLPSCYCNYFPPYHHYHTTLMPTIIIHQNCAAPSLLFKFEDYIQHNNYLVSIVQNLCAMTYLPVCLLCYKKLRHKKGKKLVVASTLSVKFTCTFNNFLLLGLGLYFLVSS